MIVSIAEDVSSQLNDTLGAAFLGFACTCA